MWGLNYTNIQAAETRHARPGDQRPAMTIIHPSSILEMRYLYHVNSKYSQVCEGSDCWLEHSWDNWFTLFAWLDLVSVLIKITIRNSVLIISYCENIITGTLIWIITGLDGLEAWTLGHNKLWIRTQGLLWACQCQSVVDEAFSAARGQPHVTDLDEITPPSVPTQWQGARK